MSLTETLFPIDSVSSDQRLNLDRLIEKQCGIMDMISEGHELSSILQAIVLWAENESQDEMLGSILLLDDSGKRLMLGAAPSLPKEYNQVIDGIVIGPAVGSCGTAAFRKENVIVENIETDPLWNGFRELALKYDLRACWSIPVVDRNGRVLATFAMYYKRPKAPSPHDLQTIRWISRTTLLAIEWKNSEIQREGLISSERKASEYVKQERQNFFNLLMNTPALVAFLKGPDFIFELANNLYLKAASRGPDIIGQPARQVLPELEEQGFFEILDNVFKTGVPFIGNEVLVKVFKEDGKLEELYLNFIYQPIKDDNGATEGILFHGVDVSELVRSKQQIQESEQRLQAMIEATPECIKIVSSNGILDFMNSTGLEMIEGDNSLISQACVYDVVAPEYREEWITNHQRVCNGEKLSWEFDIIGLKGTRRRMETHAVPLPGTEGNAHFAVTRDISERKKMEEALRQSEADLQKKVAERTAELEAKNKELERSNQNLQEFAYAASHDLKEPIRKVHFYSDRLKRMLAKKMGEEEEALFEKMETASKRMSLLIDDLLNYSQVSLGTGSVETIDLNEVVDTVLSDLDLQIDETNAVIKVDKLFCMRGNFRQLQQAFQNLIQNAIKYRKPGNTPEIEITYKKTTRKDTGLELPFEENQPLHLISVKDNGIGFDPKDAERIFQVFTRLHNHSDYRGTGVGLSIVKKVVQNHNGYILAESQPGSGSVFRLFFPVD